MGALPILLRLLDPQELAKYHGKTPTTLDFLGNYNDAVDACSFVTVEGTEPNADMQPAVFVPGTGESKPLDAKFSGARPRSSVSYRNNVLSYDMNRTLGNVFDPRPR